jgi:hypothetical protein
METLQRTANRGSISTGYDIDNSLKLEQPERITRGYSAISQKTSSDRKKTTLSYWVKRTQLNASGNGIVFIMYAGNTIMLGFENDKLRVSSSYGYSLKSNADFRDTSAWYHLVFSIDTTQGTANDRVKAYVNGSEVTSWSTQTITISQNANNGMFNEVNGDHYFGWSDSQATGCYVAEAHCIDGQALTASDFGEYDDDSGIWIPKEYDGTYGNQGYYLDFKNASSLTDDSSGNGNNFTTFYAGGAENQATDSPTNNFCTLNVISAIGNNTYTEGATKGIANAQNEQAEGTFMINKGKWYFEAQNITSTGAMFGFGKPNNWATGNPNNPGNDTSSFALANDGNVYYNSNTAASGWSTNATTDKVMIAIDLDNGFCYFGKNGTWGNSGDPTSGSSGTGGFNYVSLVTNISLGDELVPALRISYTQTHGAMFNFGGYTIMTISSAASDDNGYGTFEYAPPSGYYALCTKNLAEYG